MSNQRPQMGGSNQRPQFGRSNSNSSIATALPAYQKEDPHPAPPAWSAPHQGQHIEGKSKVGENKTYYGNEHITEKARSHLFASYRASLGATKYFSSPEEIVTHLKLLRAFETLKRKIIGQTTLTKESVKLWQVFVTNAVRKFIIYISAVKNALGLKTNDSTDEEEIFSRDVNNYVRICNFLRSHLPPLDVLMVWHTFSLNPRAYYDFLVRNQFCQFYAAPFPLDLINLAINQVSFIYNPAPEYREGYNKIIEEFLEDTSDYDLDDFQSEYLVCDVLCPICQETLLTKVPFTNDFKTGFADAGFKMVLQRTKGNCNCDFDPIITHDSLRSRQLYADIIGPKLLPNTYRYFSTIVKNEAYRAFVTKQVAKDLKPDIAKAIMPIINRANLDTCVRAITFCNHPYSKKLILRHYYMMNLIHLTVRGGMEVPEDLVGSIMRQERFWQKINLIDWLNATSVEVVISEARKRYKRFYQLLVLGNNRASLIPTMDIDLLWHIEQLSQHHYITACKEDISEYLIDHDDKAETGLIHDGYIKTARLYRQKYREDYTVCSCKYCDSIRNIVSNNQLWHSLETRKPETAHSIFVTSSDPAGLSHISLHDAIEVPSLVYFRRAIEYTYSSTTLPWITDRRKLGYIIHPQEFVIPPMTPISPSQTLQSCFYKTLHPETLQTITRENLDHPNVKTKRSR